MDNIFTFETLQEISRDKFTFLIFEFCIISILLYGVFRDIMAIGSGLKVKRGLKGNRLFYNFTIAFITLILTELINLMNWEEGYKVGIYIVNVIIIVYLGFCNAWFKNELVGIIVRLEDRCDSH